VLAKKTQMRMKERMANMIEIEERMLKYEISFENK